MDDRSLRSFGGTVVALPWTGSSDGRETTVPYDGTGTRDEAKKAETRQRN